MLDRANRIRIVAWPSDSRFSSSAFGFQTTSKGKGAACRTGNIRSAQYPVRLTLAGAGRRVCLALSTELRHFLDVPRMPCQVERCVGSRSYCW
jgi:hypothetical protein